MRKIYEVSKGAFTVKVHYNPDYSEYRSRVYEHGKAYEPGDYFTDDKEDAIGTANAMLIAIE